MMMPTGMKLHNRALGLFRKGKLLIILALLACAFQCTALYGQERDSQRLEIRRNSHNLWEVKNDIRSYRDSGQWDRDIETLIEQARVPLDKYVPGEKNYAIVMDVDETSISNYPLIEKMDFAFESPIVESGWEKWIAEASAPAIAATLSFYKEARKRGFHVFFITGRPETDRVGTEKLLKKTGYDGYDGLFMRTAADLKNSVSSFKIARRKKLTDEGYVIILNIGDQESDLVGGYSIYTLRIPNPMYFIP
jgi:acid phosphatase